MHKNLLGMIAAMAVLSVGVEATHADFIFDPQGDAVAVFGKPGPLLDIDTVALVYDANFLYFEVTFFTPIQPASSGAPNALFGLIDLDVDQSSGSGVPPIQNMWSPPFESLKLGVDFLITLFDLPTPGQVAVVDAADMSVVATVPVEFGPFSIWGAVPLGVISLPALGGKEDGIVDYTATIGSFLQPTDAGDYAGTSVLIPAPGSIVFIGIAGMVGPRRRRRR
ncbi:MAG: hypothetical protein O7C65_09095 [Planctomycetota bacterium]|nr:hypothetical protein [Planctomycetota bacterium]